LRALDNLMPLSVSGVLSKLVPVSSENEMKRNVGYKCRKSFGIATLIQRCNYLLKKQMNIEEYFGESSKVEEVLVSVKFQVTSEKHNKKFLLGFINNVYCCQTVPL